MQEYCEPGWIPCDIFEPKKQIYGKIKNGFYYVISADVNNLYFNKSPRNDEAFSSPMTEDEIRHTFQEILSHCPLIMRNLVLKIKDKWEQENKNSKKTQVERLQSNPKIVKRHNNTAEIQRKSAQREKVLSKYSAITPVVTYDEKQNIKSLFAKFNNEYVYISYDQKKPAFWYIGLTNSRVMPVEDVGEFIYAVSEVRSFEKLAYSLPKAYQAFVRAGYPAPKKVDSDILLTKIQQTLAKKISSFNAIEKTFCVKLSEKQRS